MSPAKRSSIQSLGLLYGMMTFDATQEPQWDELKRCYKNLCAQKPQGAEGEESIRICFNFPQPSPRQACATRLVVHLSGR